VWSAQAQSKEPGLLAVLPGALPRDRVTSGAELMRPLRGTRKHTDHGDSADRQHERKDQDEGSHHAAEAAE
jgi:hypothetical protein